MQVMAKKKSNRRDNNDGTLRKRKDGRWEGRLLIGYGQNGKARQQYFYGKTRAEVKEKLDTAKAKMHLGLYVEPNKTTLGEWLDLWLERYMRISLRPTTFSSYEMMVRCYLKPTIGDIPLNKLQASDIQGCLTYLLKEGKQDGTGLSRRTVEYTRTTLKAALAQAEKEELIYKNPAKATTLPSGEVMEVEAFTREEVNTFLKAAETERFQQLS